MTTEVRNPSEAPGELDLVRRFVNTLDIEEGTDDLSTPAEAKAWLEGEGWRTRVGERELRELVSFREAVRDFVGSRGTEGDEDAVAAIDSIARRYPLVVSFASSEVLFPPSNGVPGFIERVLGLVAAAEIDGSWDRMKTCANHGCRWLFFDHSRNRSRTWCTMDLCGSQAKMRAYRNRQAARASL
ncbi:MAG TPA: CGNR zinc finger domain-containing protein [Actinomycetota bacterium]|nr:CGNR zinc finger domain-containing protein [Actinomycetota bacterium]